VQRDQLNLATEPWIISRFVSFKTNTDRFQLGLRLLWRHARFKPANRAQHCDHLIAAFLHRIER
jgi:hypothetical protein